MKKSKLESVAVLLINCPYRTTVTDTCDGDVLFRLNVIFRVNVVLNRTVVVDSDWHFDNLCGSHLQSQSELYHAQVVKTSVTVNSNSHIQDYFHPDDHSQPTYEMTPWFKPFTMSYLFVCVFVGLLDYQTHLELDF